MRPLGQPFASARSRITRSSNKVIQMRVAYSMSCSGISLSFISARTIGSSAA